MREQLLADVFSVAFNSPSKKVVKEATMNDIPHEIDDVVHKLKSIRFDMEELKKTWQMAGMDLLPLDNIIEGVNNLIKSVYNNGAQLADQQIGSEEEKESSLKEEDLNEEDSGWEKISLSSLLDLLKLKENELLEKAFKRGVRMIRSNMSSDEVGEIKEAYISPEGNLKIIFKDISIILYAYVDGGFSTQEGV